MNSVHEPDSRTMSKNRLRKNTESIRIKNRPSAPSAQPVASPRAQAARPCRALPARRCRPAVARLRAPHAPAPHAPAACAPRAPCLPSARPARPACHLRSPRTPCAPSTCPAPCCKCSGCIAIQPCLVTIQFLYCDTISLQPSLLQYNPAIQLIPLLCNTI